MSLIRYTPRGLTPWFDFDVDRFFADWPLSSAQSQPRTWSPAVDVYEDDKSIVVKADLPDVKKENVKVQVQNGVLVIEGERQKEKEEKGRRFQKIEREYGTFVRRFALPAEIDPAKVLADFKDGVLRIRLPKTPAAKPNLVDVTVG